MAQVTLAEFKAFMERVGARGPCEVCGNQNFTVPPAGQGMEVAMPVLQRNGYSVPPPSIPAVAAVCTKCGNLRFHALAIVKPGAMG